MRWTFAQKSSSTLRNWIQSLDLQNPPFLTNHTLSGGRGKAWHLGEVLIKAHRRGGMAGAVLPHRWLRSHPFLAEMEMTGHLADMGAPVPRIWAVGEHRGERWSVVEWLEDSSPLIPTVNGAIEWATPLVETLDILFELGAVHPDLNLGNFLWKEGRVWVVDWRGGWMEPPPTPRHLRRKMALRLLRSWDKSSPEAGDPGWLWAWPLLEKPWGIPRWEASGRVIRGWWRHRKNRRRSRFDPS